MKRAASVLARLHECKYLLLSLVVITVLPAIPELFIRSKSWCLFLFRTSVQLSTRSTVVSFGQGVCILSTRFDCRERKKDFRLPRIFPRDAMYALYILFKLLLRHLLPVVLVLLCLFRPR